MTHNWKDWKHAAACTKCNAKRKEEHTPQYLLIGTVPGAHNDSRGDAQYNFQKNFDKGIDAYKKAKGEGLQPKATTVEAVDAAHKEVKSQQRALKKLGLHKDPDAKKELRLAPGVG